MLLRNKKIAIVGGGPGGLLLARLLQQEGMAVRVFERDKDRYARQQGATLDLHADTGLKAIAAAGLLDVFKQKFRPGADRMRITDGALTIHLDEHIQEQEKEFGSAHFRPEIDRGPLRELLTDALEQDTIVWNAQLTGMRSSGEGWELLFKEQQPVYADFVIAADGARSVLRKYLTAIQPVYSGVTVMEGTIYNAADQTPALWQLTAGGKLFALEGGKSIILSAKGDGSLSFYTGTRESEGDFGIGNTDFNDKVQVAAWFRSRFSDWSAAWNELFTSADSYFIPRPQYYFPTDQSWDSLPNLTMLGDAAHCMPPYAGEGVNMALADAYDLYEVLVHKEYPSLKTAIAGFEQGMCERAAAVTTVTLEQTDALHTDGNLEYMLRFFEQGR